MHHQRGSRNRAEREKDNSSSGETGTVGMATKGTVYRKRKDGGIRKKKKSQRKNSTVKQKEKQLKNL